MDSIVYLGLGLAVVGVCFTIGTIATGYIWMQTTIYRQGQLNYRAAVKAQADMRNAQPHQGSDGGILAELMPLVEIATRPDMQPLVQKFLQGKQPIPVAPKVETDGTKIQ